MKLTRREAIAAASALASGVGASPAPSRRPVRIFASERLDMDGVLARPWSEDVPFGSSGELLWAGNPQGWGFPDSVHLLYITNLHAFEVVVNVNGVAYTPAHGVSMPSHVHQVGLPAEGPTAFASFTFTTDRVDNPLTQPFVPEKRWTCWSSGNRTDWYQVNLGGLRKLDGLTVWFYSDQPNGGCAPPDSVSVETRMEGGWRQVSIAPLNPVAGPNRIGFAAPVFAREIRLTFRNRDENLYTGLYGFQPSFAPGDRPARPAAAPVQVSGDKWIAGNDVMVSVIRLENTGATPLPAFLRMDSELSGTLDGFADERLVDGFPVYLRGGADDGLLRQTSFWLNLQPRKPVTLAFAMAAGRSPAEADARLHAVLSARPDSLLAAQQRRHAALFEANCAVFACSDPMVTKMYRHRWYNLLKNSMKPGLGALRYRTFAEGRWTADWYANVISYGAGHQIRESRWLRDPDYAWGHLQTWCKNPRPDGIFPSHITPHGQQGGQYTDWIASTAWDVYQVHADRERLASVADPVAANAEGWRRVYGWDNSPLLVVDSHWWTGMEWQPSFFSFAGYHTNKPGDETHLRRVDLTAYNFGNAGAAARIYRELGRAAEAARLQRLADSTQAALLRHCWNPATNWFHSLRYSDLKPSPAKEIIGIYPFYFNLPPPGKGYETLWNTALSADYFWTHWPLASASRDCPAYSQTGWPNRLGPGGSGCMWNGPTWPHANSLVMSAMINTLRSYPACALQPRHLLELFVSFTRAQFRDQDRVYPWTGEYYNGDTGAWKTEQRDYNHSTWIDPLITGLIGIVPRSDDVLEVDSLLPRGAWSHYLLDGQHLRGHSVTIAWDGRGGVYAPNFKGFGIWIDGHKRWHSARPARVKINMNTGAIVPPEEI
ncbi:MAG: hypothetical protein KGJ62_13115 [Armatimonadetes bacterium]|nr:hypothetical protein [Armatimonadota bacterium]MDE2206134.1 hypothetical protein [Armatimonadota bacterium]